MNIGIVLPELGFDEALRVLTLGSGNAARHRRDAHVLLPGGRLHWG